jgi:putative toxin-antitoxin system antitoxin component (TIGR02293 family)
LKIPKRARYWFLLGAAEGIEAVNPSYDAGAIAHMLGLRFTTGTKATATTRARGPDDARGVTLRVNGRIVEVTALDPAARRQPSRVPSGLSAALDPSPLMIEMAVEVGLPRQSLSNIARFLSDDDAARATAFEKDIIPKSTLARRTARFNTRESEHIERVARLTVQAARVLGGQPEARRFLFEPHPALHGERPFDLTRTELGARRVEHLLEAVAYGLPR